MKKNNSGFTLVEILVVVAIMAILTGIVIASTSSARKNKSYVKRLSDLGQIDNAITRYQLSTGKYPNTSSVWRTTGTCASLSSTATTTGYVPGVTMSLPTDPNKATNCTTGPMYAYKSDGRDYKLIVFNNQEDKTYVASKNPDRVDPIRTATSTTPAFGFWSTGGKNW